MDDPLVIELVHKYTNIFITEIVNIFVNLDTNKTFPQIIEEIENEYIPKIKIHFVEREKSLEIKKQELQKQIEIFKEIKLEEDDFAEKVFVFLDEFYKILGTESYKEMITKNIEYLVDSLLGFCLELYHVMFPILTNKQYTQNEFIEGLDDIIGNVVDPSLSYYDILVKHLGEHWQKHVEYNCNIDFLKNTVNFKNINMNTKNEAIKKAEIKLIIKWYTIFFEEYDNFIIEVGQKFLPSNIQKWLPTSTDLFFGKPIIIDIIYNYLHSSGFKITNVCCSKEFIKGLIICKKSFK